MSATTLPGLGRLPSVDIRDSEFPMRAALAPAAQPPMRHTWYAPRALDQGATSSCVGHAWAGWLLASPLPNNAGPGPFAIYADAQQQDEWPGEAYDGTSVRAGAKVLQAAGLLSTYVWATDAETVADFVLAHAPVVMGTGWFSDMFRPGKGGLVTPSGRNMGGHAYLCIGYHRARGMFRFLNSWGVGYGQGGRFSMLGEHLGDLLEQGGEACAGVELEGQS